MFIVILIGCSFFLIIAVVAVLTPKQTGRPLTNLSSATSKSEFDKFKYLYGQEDYSPYSFDEVRYSPNKEYCVSFYRGSETNSIFETGKIALINKGRLIFEIPIDLPNECQVSNNGTVICCHELPKTTNILSGIFTVFDNQGKTIFNYEATANLCECGVSSDSLYCAFKTAMSKTDNSDKTFIVDLITKQNAYVIIGTGQYHTNVLKVNSKGQTISFIDYNKNIRKVTFKGKEIIKTIKTNP